VSASVALVGMPGGGKSTVGKQLARRLNVPFFDTDDIIRQQVGCSMAAFFEAQGEERFRDVEGRALQGLLARTTETGRVIATGGGIVLREANRQALANDAISIYLRAGPEELFRRVRHDTRRPLLRVRDPLAKLRDLYTQRDPLYRAVSAFVIETGRPSVSMLVNLILMQLELAGLVDTERLVSDSVKSSTQGKA
jgi:shikimate kinase